MHHNNKNTNQQPENREYLITCRWDAVRMMRCCPHAQTLAGFSQTLRETVYLPLACKQWTCRICAEDKIRVLAAKTREATPNRMLTLTVNPACWTDPRNAYDGTRRQISVLFTHLRKIFGDIEYLRVTELDKKGWPHYHLLLRSGYIPHGVIKREWERLTGAIIVDIRPVKKSLNAYKYLVKYLSKIHSIPWTDRHISYSRSFFPPEDPQSRNPLELDHVETIPRHPVNVVMAAGIGAVWRCVRRGVYALVRENPNFDQQPSPNPQNDDVAEWADEDF